MSFALPKSTAARRLQRLLREVRLMLQSRKFVRLWRRRRTAREIQLELVFQPVPRASSLCCTHRPDNRSNDPGDC
ncbi:MAG TPA: hypothetical protein VMN36_16910 [Verrucomicrobiales bacterium]|nr:hypothetical protein [Verrucomicrobiales bacterium]